MRALLLLAPLLLLGCGSRYSADEYATRAVQQANPVQRGVVAGSRRVAIAADGTAGAAAGAAAGGVVGGVAGGNRITNALGAVGGGLVGGLIGTAAERAAVNAEATEYIIAVPRDGRDELVSVTQRDAVPIPINTRVLVISGAQARVVPDYLPAGAPLPATLPAPAPAPVQAAPVQAAPVQSAPVQAAPLPPVAPAAAPQAAPA
ncbi:hypothetical protein ACI6QG_19315, partial [Roseococcus sp. DSY-14]|uniref:hypothetical protein n=1 Tax=Roseococcus sp. DSY-14 TaxID=3369650 RepID=UPI00387AB6BF